ncbi:MAG: hypothetical protein Q4E06_10930 [Lautropia sp.]|nr:hypothetical protein [Lautropia sp.]
MSQPQAPDFDYLTDINLDDDFDDFGDSGQRLGAAAALVFGMARSLHWRVADKVLDQLDTQYRRLPSPAGDGRTGFDFLGILKNEGPDNPLHELTMGLLRNDIENIARGLPDIEQIALVYPLVEDLIDVDELVHHVHPADWASALRADDGSGLWSERLRERLMNERVQECERHVCGVDDD